MNKVQIIKLIKSHFNVDNIDLIKINGIWYWCGDLTVNWQETCTHITKLKNTDNSFWIYEFNEKYSLRFF